MEKISFMRRLSSSLIDKVLILVLFIISALCISPYGMASHLGSYYALLDAVPSSYPVWKCGAPAAPPPRRRS